MASCETATSCVAMSGIFGSWCIGCKEALSAGHKGAVAYAKTSQVITCLHRTCHTFRLCTVAHQSRTIVFCSTVNILHAVLLRIIIKRQRGDKSEVFELKHINVLYCITHPLNFISLPRLLSVGLVAGDGLGSHLEPKSDPRAPRSSFCDDCGRLPELCLLILIDVG